MPSAASTARSSTRTPPAPPRCWPTPPATAWDAIERESGVTRAGVEAFARLLIERPKAVFVWSMGLTQHAHGVDTVKALVNLGLARGLPARPGSGLVPIRGHSGVQGGAEVGCVPGRAGRDARPLGRGVGLRAAGAAGMDGDRSHHRERGRRGRHVLDGRRQLARDAAGHRGGGSARWRGRACASTRTSCCRRRCWSRAPATC